MPSIVFSTSRDPAKKTRSFIRDIVNVIPQASRFVRGKRRLNYVLHLMKSKGYHTAVIINSIRGNPNFCRIFDLTGEEIKELPWAIKLYGYTLEREYSKVERKRRQSAALVLISTIDDRDADTLLKIVFNATETKVSKLTRKSIVTAYVDYLDPKKKILFIEFIDREGYSVGPRLRLKLVPRRIDKDIYSIEAREVEKRDD